MSQMYSLEVEKHFLACLLQNSKNWPEVCIINEKDFSKYHSVIFQIIRAEIQEGKPLSTVLMAEKISSYGISLETVEPYDYLEALKLIPIREAEIKPLAKQLKLLTVLRDFSEIGKKIQKISESADSREKTFIEIVSEIDKIYNDKINLYSREGDEPIDLFKDIKENIEAIGNNPKDEGVIIKAFQKFMDYFGSFTPGDLYVFAARAKAGKSTLLMNMMFDACNAKENGDIRGLYLDTELETYRVQRRIVSSLSGVSPWWLRTGFWRKNPEMEKRVRKVWENCKEYFDKIDHIYIGGKPFEEVLSIIRRWHHKNIARFSNKKAIVAFDYIKLGEENPTTAIKDYVIIGKKVDKLKQIATELQMPILTSCQTNRSNEGRKDSSNITDDGSAIGLSDQINQFASCVFLFRRMAQDERVEYGDDFTHLLMPLYTRELGKDTSGTDLVKYMDSSNKIAYKENFIRLKFEKFSVQEKGDFKEWIQREGRVPPDHDDPHARGLI